MTPWQGPKNGFHHVKMTRSGLRDRCDIHRAARSHVRGFIESMSCREGVVLTGSWLTFICVLPGKSSDG